MLRNPRFFVGRWIEIQQLTESMERRTPALVIGPSGSGRSTLLYHVVEAAPVLLDQTGMRAYYIDLAEFPDIDALRNTVAAAFQQQPSRWLMMLPELQYPPLLAFDNIDAPQLADTIHQWWAELLPAIRTGTLRCIAAAKTADTSYPWREVPMRAVDVAMLNELVVAVLGEDGPRPTRNEQTWLVKACGGLIGPLMLMLNIWYAQRGQPGDWRVLAQAHAVAPASLQETGTMPIVVPRDDFEVAESDAPVLHGDTASDQRETPVMQEFEVPAILWWMMGLMAIGVAVYWLMQR
ncbi:MAG: hypothetical protein ACK5GU_04915 [Chloroflexota bacterium]|jgi:hypothetical protein